MKFVDYVMEKTISLETEHKPLVLFFSITHLDRMPPQVLQFLLHVIIFDYNIEHVPEILVYIADTLSCASTAEIKKTELFVKALVAYLPAKAVSMTIKWFRRQTLPALS